MSQSPLHCWWTYLVYSSPDPNQKEQQTGSHLGGERAMNQRADLRTPAGRARGAPLHALWWPGREKAPEREDMYTQSWFTLPCSRNSHHCKATILQYTPIKVIKKKKRFHHMGKRLGLIYDVGCGIPHYPGVLLQAKPSRKCMPLLTNIKLQGEFLAAFFLLCVYYKYGNYCACHVSLR